MWLRDCKGKHHPYLVSGRNRSHLWVVYANMKKMADKVVCYGFIFLSLISFTRILAFTSLEPEKLLLNQVLHHQETEVYHLVQLKPGRTYELRVSYPSTTPTDFCINLISREALRRPSRELLNIDKLVFNNHLSVMEQFANVTAIRTGVPLNSASLAEPVVYNIVLEELFLGVPWHVWRLAVLVIVIVFVTVKYLVPCALSFMEQSAIKAHEKR